MNRSIVGAQTKFLSSALSKCTHLPRSSSSYALCNVSIYLPHFYTHNLYLIASFISTNPRLHLVPFVSCVSFASPRTAWGGQTKGAHEAGDSNPTVLIHRHNSIPLHRRHPIQRGRYINHIPNSRHSLFYAQPLPMTR